MRPFVESGERTGFEPSEMGGGGMSVLSPEQLRTNEGVRTILQHIYRSRVRSGELKRSDHPGYDIETDEHVLAWSQAGMRKNVRVKVEPDEVSIYGFARVIDVEKHSDGSQTWNQYDKPVEGFILDTDVFDDATAAVIRGELPRMFEQVSRITRGELTLARTDEVPAGYFSARAGTGGVVPPELLPTATFVRENPPPTN